jgi:hypothetical protein
MYDIVFYCIPGCHHDRIFELKKKFPTAKFLELKKNNYVLTAQAAMAQVKTSKFWLIPVTVEISKPTLPYKVEKWDDQYVHYQKLGNSELFLISKTHTITEDQINKNFFNDTKFVNFEIFYKHPAYIYDVFFLSYNEPCAEKNYQRLLEKVPTAHHISGVKGIFDAHFLAATKSTTPFFWVVDADAEVVNTFNFDYEPFPWDFDILHIWKSKNVINDLIYGNGGIKLIPRHVIFDSANDAIDITTSLSCRIKVIDEVSNLNNFCVDEFSAWRSAFRECTKLSSKTIQGQIDAETEDRLKIWCTVGDNKPFGEFVIAGALAGKEYGEKNASNIEALKLINDFDWLRSQFETNSVAIGNI